MKCSEEASFNIKGAVTALDKLKHYSTSVISPWQIPTSNKACTEPEANHKYLHTWQGGKRDDQIQTNFHRQSNCTNLNRTTAANTIRLGLKSTQGRD